MELEGVIVGDYFLLERLAREGSVELYRARPITRGGYDVLMRLFKPPFPDAMAFREHFQAEVEKVWRCQHPHILPLLEFGSGDDLLYAITALPAVPTLEQTLRKQPYSQFSLSLIEKIMLQLCSALQYAHERHIVHGNIQPSSMYFGDDGEILLSNFSMQSPYCTGQTLMTHIGEGNIYYMAPEQGFGIHSRACDIYALGVLCYRLLTGELPYDGETAEEIMVRHTGDALPSLQERRPDLPSLVGRVIHCALAKLPEQRFPYVEEFALALHTAFSSSEVMGQEERRHIAVHAHRTPALWPSVALF